MSAPKNPRTTLAVVTPAQIAPIRAVDIMPVLLSELQKADQIIIALLNAMTLAQKTKVAARLDAAGVSGEGMTRHHERRAVIVSAEAALGQATALETPLSATPAELNLIRSFRAMNDSSQTFIGRTADSLAEKTPRRVTPTLRLIAGGAA
jgi:hypothetical protein